MKKDLCVFHSTEQSSFYAPRIVNNQSSMGASSLTGHSWHQRALQELHREELPSSFYQIKRLFSTIIMMCEAWRVGACLSLVCMDYYITAFPHTFVIDVQSHITA